MKKHFTLLLFLISSILLANDGVYKSNGGILYPINETSISIKKETLTFKIANDIAETSIYFEFFNPESTTKELLIGFQAPSAAGDVSKIDANTNSIKDFIIQYENQIIPYKLMKSECEDCELKDAKDLEFDGFSPGVYVYLFKIKFKPGINKVYHSYSFSASNNVAIQEFYQYILTTGSKWKNNTIDDFTLNIDMGKNTFFYVSDVFGKKSVWNVIGSGKVTNEEFEMEKFQNKMIRIISGTLQIKVENFKPENNIEFGRVNKYFFTTYPVYYNLLKQNKSILIQPVVHY